MHTTTAERTGRWFGRMWQGCVQQETRAIQWLVGKGLSVSVARSLLWIMKLVVFAVLLYVAFWLALLLLFGIAAAWVARDSASDWENENNEEWCTGPAGYGLYTYDGHRIDPHVHDDDV